MAEAAAERPCKLSWGVVNPFVPCEKREATFYHRYPCLTLWKVTLQTSRLGFNRWCVLLSLNGEKSGERDDSILAEGVEVNILLNGKEKLSERSANYRFCRDNRYTCLFRTDVETQPFGMRPEHDVNDRLQIVVTISFPNRNIKNQESDVRSVDFDDLRNPQNDAWDCARWGGIDDLRQLSKDMWWLLHRRRLYKDTRLTTQDPSIFFAVHSCILRARWSHFYEVHNVEIADYTFATNLSVTILMDLLIYLYCGKLVMYYRTLDEEYTTELYQLIDRYRMYHLYKNFVTDDSQQERTTTTSLEVVRANFELNGPDGLPSNEKRHVWRVFENTEHSFTMEMKFIFHDPAPLFSYSLKSNWPPKAERYPLNWNFKFHVQVSLELDYLANRPTWVHQRDFVVRAGETENSNTCEFDRYDLLQLDRFIRDRRSRVVRCTLCVSTGYTSISLETGGTSVGVDYADDLERLRVLSDHISDLQMEDDDRKDLAVVCQSGQPEIPDIRVLLHKAIFLARVPLWMDKMKLIGPSGGAGSIPYVVESEHPCLPDIFPFIVDYIYSGKCSPFPGSLFLSASNYAYLTGMEAFSNLIRLIWWNIERSRERKHFSKTERIKLIRETEADECWMDEDNLSIDHANNFDWKIHDLYDVYVNILCNL